MADLRRIRKTYPSEPPDANITILRNEPPGYVFSVDGSRYDFRDYARHRQKSLDVAWHMAIAIWRRREKLRKATLQTNYGSAIRFLEYLDCRPNQPTIAGIDRPLLAEFIFWAQNLADRRDGDGRVSQGTGARWWRSIAALFNELRRDLNLKLSPSLRLPAVTSPPDKATKSYSRAERDQILRACYREISQRRSDRDAPGVVCHEDLVPYALILATRAGLNPTVLLELPEDPVRQSLISGLAWLRTGVKHRSGAAHTHPAVTPAGAREEELALRLREAELISEVRALTKPLREVAPDEVADCLWLVGSVENAGSTNPRKKIRRMTTSGKLYPAMQSLASRYNITADDGSILTVTLQRCRPTFAEEYLRANGGDLVDLQRRLGQRSLRTTTRYVDLKASDRRRSFKFAGLVLQSLSLGDGSLPSDEELAGKYQLSVEEITKLRSGENNVAVARCRNPFNSPVRGIPAGEACSEFMICLRCPNMVVLKDDLHRLFSFYWYLYDKKAQIGKIKFKESYSWIIDTIDGEIVPKLNDPSAAAAAKTEARIRPHPLWSNADAEE